MNSIKKAALLLLLIPSFAQAMMATVVRSIPVYENRGHTETRCVQETVTRTETNPFGLLIGVAVGAAAGGSFHGGLGQETNAVLGGLVGGAWGHQIANGPNRVERCYPETRYEARLLGYDVHLRIDGREFIQRLPYNPEYGSQIPVQITVR